MRMVATTRLVFFLAFLQALLLVAIITSTYVIKTTPPGGYQQLNRPGEPVKREQKHEQVKEFIRPGSCPEPGCSNQIPETETKLKRHALSIGALRLKLDENIGRALALPIVNRSGIAPPQCVLLTTTNYNFSSIMDNWLESLRRLRIRYDITLMSEDNETLSYFSRRSNSEFKVVSSADFKTPGRLGRNIPTYQQLIRKRTVYIYTLLKSGRDVLLVDVDAVWMKDPLPLVFDNYGKFDIWVAQGREPNFPCPCFLYMKSIPRVIDLILKWIQVLAFAEKVYTDQNALALLLKSPKLNVKVNYLGYELFPLGSQYFNDTWHALHADEVYVVHGNHLGRGAEKIEKFKQHGIWYLEKQ